ncbi:MAG TPA: copper chaperone PCu(A)C [Pseudolabrys sp.]|nr:copper chaperone PCu(A)C [Pseudolabrys sp.]
MRSRTVFDTIARSAFVVVVVAFFACGITWAHAQDVTAGSLKISAAWTRATPKGAPVGGGYLTITNNGTAPDRLIGGSSDTSSRFEIHNMTMDNGVMKMRPVDAGIEIKPGQTIELKPGGYHVMFVGLKKPFEQGDHVKATLKFEKAGDVPVDFAVEGIGAQTGGMPMQHGR